MSDISSAAIRATTYVSKLKVSEELQAVRRLTVFSLSGVLATPAQGQSRPHSHIQ